ncbi:hypothetical protein [Burkholderia phage BCSR5]|nr:hypothetical protein [Burkholderia phage BCSR5]
MKFINAKKPKEYAEQVVSIDAQIAELRAQIAALEEERDDIVEYLDARVGETFEYRAPDGTLRRGVFSVTAGKKILDRAKVERFYESIGKRLPMKSAKQSDKFTVLDVSEE